MIKNYFINILFAFAGLFVFYKIVKELLRSTIQSPEPAEIEIEEIRRRQEATLRMIQNYQQFQVWVKYGGPLVDLKPGDALTLRKRLEKVLEKIWREEM